MRKRLGLGLVATLILGGRSVDAQVINPVSLLLPAGYRTLSLAPYREDLERFLSTFSFHRQADGGGDGGGDGSGSGTGTGSSSGDTGSSGSDSSGSASDSTGPGDDSDPDADPSTTDNSIGPNAAVPPTDPTNPTTALDYAAQQAYDAVNNPFGGVSGPVADGAADSGVNPVSGVPGSPGTLSPRPPDGSPASVSPPSSNPVPPAPVTPSARRNQIHAVIVSGLSDPSQVLTGNVELTGGIVALGPPDPTNPQIAGHWDPNVRITPDPELLNGHKIPPLVPNVIDVRIMHHEVSATIESEGTISGHP